MFSPNVANNSSSSAGSTNEAVAAGVPLIVIPVMVDQNRNANVTHSPLVEYEATLQVVRRIGTGIVLEKEDLASGQKLQETLREMLQTDK